MVWCTATQFGNGLGREMPERAYLKVGDRTTAGGVVIEGLTNTDDVGTALTYLFAKVWCPVCNSHGVIAPSGARPDDDLLGRQPALEYDICECLCRPKPRLIASQRDLTAWI